MSDPETIRLFVALSVPETVKNSLCDLQRELRGILREAAVRWTPREQTHLTLRFFGNVETDHLPELEASLRNACQSAPVLKLQAHGLGAFPPKRPPRVLWVGVHDRENQLGPLQNSIQTATAEFGEKPETREFSAHLTLGRIKEIRRPQEHALRDFIANHSNCSYGEWTAHEVELVQSYLGPSGAKHSVLSQYPLHSS